MKIRTHLWLSACAAALLGVNALSAQEGVKPAPKPMPMPAPTPAQGAIHAAPNYQYSPACCQPDCGGNKGGCYVLAEAVYVRARSDSFDAFLSLDANDNATLHVFDFERELSPRFTVGWSNCDGQGIRFRWFRYESDDQRALQIGPGVATIDRSIYQSDQQYFADTFTTTTGNFIAARTDLSIHVYDIEGTSSMEMGGVTLVVSAGARIIDNESTLEAGEFVGTTFVEDGYRVRFAQKGYGPTISAEARMCLGGITGFVGVRTSYILSETDVAVEGVDEANYSSSRDDGLFINELTLGAECSHECCWGRLFVRAAWEVQLWKDAGLATRIGENFGRNSNLYLEGFSLGVGFEK